MPMPRTALLCLAAIAGLILAAGDAAFAQQKTNIGRASANTIGRAPTNAIGTTPSRGGGNQGGGYRGGIGWGAAVPGVLMTLPNAGPSRGDVFIDDGTVDDGPRGRPPQRANTSNNRPSGAPPANERRLIPDEVVAEVASSTSPQVIDALQRRFNLQILEQQSVQLTGTTFVRLRIPDRRSVTTVVHALEVDRRVSPQPNYLFRLQQDATRTEAKTEGDPAQYELAKLHLPQAHALATGDKILVAVIDSGIDASHPELAGSVLQSFDAVETAATPHKHGTSIAGLIVAHGKLMGAAPRAQILAIRAFDPSASGAEGSTFSILKSLDWAAANGARVINMSFAGPPDPAMHRSLEAARKKGIVLVAAAGNAGAKSPPLFPAADPNVIAVSATDADDKLFEASNRGRHIAIAAPGAQLLVAIPDGGYEVASGTSYSAAEISGIVALMLERQPDLTPDKVRAVLKYTARDLGPKGPDIMFGAGLADAFAAVMAEPASALAATPRPVERVSTGAR